MPKIDVPNSAFTAAGADQATDETKKPLDQKMIDTVFKQVEKTLQIPEFGGIVDDALKCSIFG